MSAKKTQRRQAARRQKRKSTRRSSGNGPACGLCGATNNLTKTACCNHWICDDEQEYVMFSYARNSCHRNHDRYTLCGFHYHEGHTGRWQECGACREEIEPEMYVYYGTNEYNFEVLENPPDFEPTRCARCGRIIVLSEGGSSYGADGYTCGSCMAAQFPKLYR